MLRVDVLLVVTKIQKIQKENHPPFFRTFDVVFLKTYSYTYFRMWNEIIKKI